MLRKVVISTWTTTLRCLLTEDNLSQRNSGTIDWYQIHTSRGAQLIILYSIIGCKIYLSCAVFLFVVFLVMTNNGFSWLVVGKGSLVAIST